jgi:predicted extracellular nuclease
MISPRFDRKTLILLLLPAFLIGLLGQAQAADNIFFSEYLEGTQDSGIFNHALEIFNPTQSVVDAAVELISIEIYMDGSPTPNSTLNFGESSGVLIQPGDTFVIVQTTADPELLALADRTSLGLGAMDGNDAVVLRRGGEIVDVIGQVGFDPGPGGWGTGETSTVDHTLRRKMVICEGDSDGSDAFNPALEWDGFPIDTFDGLGSHETNCSGTPVETTTWGSVKALFR